MNGLILILKTFKHVSILMEEVQISYSLISLKSQVMGRGYGYKLLFIRKHFSAEIYL